VPVATFHFEVQETTIRSASVDAATLTEARKMLRAWADSSGSKVQGIELGDLETVKIVSRVASK
jgi:hypothetical protein